MSAAQPKASEPSMEEILASIRKIISDDTAKPASPPAAAAPAPVPPAAAEPARPEPSKLEFIDDEDDEEVMDLKPQPPAAKAPEPHYLAEDPLPDDLAFEEPLPPPAPVAVAPPVVAPAPVFAAPPVEAVPTPPPVQPAPPVAAQEIAPPERLVSQDTDKLVSANFAQLANTMLTKNSRTLEDLMQDMMRPMIKSWLDENLPQVVERLVKAEIERVARGGR